MELKELIDKQYRSLVETEGDTTFRNKGLENFIRYGVPSTKHEEWKYVDFNKVLKANFSFQASELQENDITPFLFDGLDAYLVVLVNGHFSEKFSQIGQGNPFVKIQNFQEAKSFLSDRLNAYADAQNNPFSSMSAALATSGVYIEVPEGQVVNKPILILNINDNRDSPTLSVPRNFFWIKKNAQVKVIESNVSMGSQEAFTNGYTEIYAEQGSVSEYYKLQLQDTSSSLVDTTQIIQDQASAFTCTTVTLSGNLIRNNLNFILNGENCVGNMNGLFMLKGATVVDNHTTVDHVKPNSISHELYKGVLDEKSTGVFNGKIFVRQDAQKTNAYQSNKNMLLSEDASMNTKPQLEIWAHDVKCSHGATTGKLDREMLFYLKARGINDKAAKAILTNAFAHDVLNRITIGPVREHLDQAIAERLGLDL